MVSGAGLVLQSVRIVLGFILGLAGAGIFLAWGFFQAIPDSPEPVLAGAVVATGLVSAALIGALAFVPAALAIVLAEVLRLRGAIYHVAVGGLIAFALWALGDAGSLPDVTQDAAGYLRPGTTVALASGFVAGAIYWLVAGRSSGNWRHDGRAG